MEVALLMAGASVTGAVFGILAGRGFRRDRDLVSEPEALVPYIGERPAKARRLARASEVSTELHRMFLDVRDATTQIAQEMLTLRQDLQLCRCAQLQSCKQLRMGQLDAKEIQEHVAMLSLLGSRLGIDPTLIAALPSAAAGARCGSPPSMHVLELFERSLQSHEISLEGRLAALAEQEGLLEPHGGFPSVAGHKAADVAGIASSVVLRRPAIPEASDLREDFEGCPTLILTHKDSDGESSTSEGRSYLSGRGPSPIVEELVDEEPEFVNFWENDVETDSKPLALTKPCVKQEIQETAPKRGNRSVPSPANSADTTGDVEESKDPGKLAALALLQHASAKDMSVIKGLKSEDIKKVVAHRKKHGPLRQLDALPGILGPEHSVVKHCQAESKVRVSSPSDNCLCNVLVRHKDDWI
ncbi:RPL18 [Symbiodinium sp. CCMP2456]|nr:RPL18 [Symbiodinium sp. CCMP2456]